MKELSQEQLDILSRNPFGDSPITSLDTGISSLLSPDELSLLLWARRRVLELGADDCLLKLFKLASDSIQTLNGEIDQVSHTLDRYLTIEVYIGGKSGSYTSNKYTRDSLEDFLRRAIESVSMMEPDPANGLPEIDICHTDAGSPLSLGNADLETYGKISAEDRTRFALSCSLLASPDPQKIKSAIPEGCTLVSEEMEYTDRVGDIVLLNSRGAAGRSIHTTFYNNVQVTIKDEDGNLQSGYTWHKHTHWDKFTGMEPERDVYVAIDKALGKRGSAPVASSKYTMVTTPECSSRLFTPMANAMAGARLHQKRSFLCDSLGKKLFPSFLTVWDRPRTPGYAGCYEFDTDGVETYDMPVIEEGVLKNYYIDAYSSRKLGIPPTMSSMTRPEFTPTADRVEDLHLDSYILVTALNGGNCNPVTGDFSYGIEGFKVEGDGKTPVNGMLVTGNILTLWAGLTAVVGDFPEKFNEKIGILVFEGVDFSGTASGTEDESA